MVMTCIHNEDTHMFAETSLGRPDSCPAAGVMSRPVTLQTGNSTNCCSSTNKCFFFFVHHIVLQFGTPVRHYHSSVLLMTQSARVFVPPPLPPPAFLREQKMPLQQPCTGAEKHSFGRYIVIKKESTYPMPICQTIAFRRGADTTPRTQQLTTPTKPSAQGVKKQNCN